MGLLIRAIVFVVTVLSVVYALAAGVSLLVGLVRFLIEAPGAIRQDLRDRRAPTGMPRPVRYVENEEHEPLALPAPRALPPHVDGES
jgi:hypothetical protein